MPTKNSLFPELMALKFGVLCTKTVGARLWKQQNMATKPGTSRLGKDRLK